MMERPFEMAVKKFSIPVFITRSIDFSTGVRIVFVALCWAAAAMPVQAQYTGVLRTILEPVSIREDASEPDDELCRPDIWPGDAVELAPPALDEMMGGAETDSDGDGAPFAEAPNVVGRANEEGKTDWNKTMLQSLFFLGVMHGYRIWYEPDTRAALGGPFFKDYFRAVKHLRGWNDGDSFLTNYIGHPMMGATAGRILLHNTPRERRLEPGLNREYLHSRLRAFKFSALFSLQFEIGLISEGTIGHAMPNEHTRTPFSWQDIVVTPTAGTAWLIGEDMLDRYLVRPIEQWTNSRTIRVLARSFLNPTRSMANLMRIKSPWYRDDRP
ncbi:MAG: hypothetical protein KF868_19600 [Acidobacteria bacterium]|nr:hypothetical protein [Acidobacteriota bacterium]MCW5971592.1 hypothetical protein [Blastocatellales bacterium]